MTQTSFDWAGLEAAAIHSMVNAVRTIHEKYPHECLYGAMFHAFYGDGSVIYWPTIAVGSEESLAQIVQEYQRRGHDEPADELSHSLRWSGADLPHSIEAEDEQDAWAQACCDFASVEGTYSAWEKIYDRYMHIFPVAAKKAREQLVLAGIVDADFIAVTMDEAEDLVPLSLTDEQVSRHFPYYQAAEQERQSLAALPVEQRLAVLVPQAVRAVAIGLLNDEYEALIRELGIAAVPALVAVVRGEQPGQAWQACRILAQINEATDEAIAALTALLDKASTDNSTRVWAASALARLGQSALLVDRIHTLPEDIIASGMGGPYRSFANEGHRRSLDYQPLEEMLSRYPHMEEHLEQSLAPGRGFCRITPQEEPVARAALASSWAVIRRHAECVLEDLEDKLVSY